MNAAIAWSARAALVATVAHLARHYHVDIDHDELTRRLDNDSGDDVLERVLAGVGLRSSRVTLNTTAVLTKASQLAPAVLLDATDAVVGTIEGLSGPPWRRMVRLRRLDGQHERLTAADVAGRVGSDEVTIVVVEAPLVLGSTDHVHHISPWQRLIALVDLERRDVAVVVIFGVLVALLSLATPLAVQALVSGIASSALLQPLIVVSVVLGVAILAGSILRVLQFTVVELLQRRIFVRLVADLAWRLPRLTVDERNSNDTSKLVNRFFDVVTAQKAIASLLLEGATLLLEVAIGLLVLAVYSPLLLVMSASLVVGVFFIVFVLGKGGIESSVDESYAKHDVAGWLEELVRHPTVFRGAASRDFGLLRADAASRAYLSARRRHFRVLLRQAIGGFALQILASVTLLGLGGWLVIDGTLTLGQLMAAELIVTAVTWGLVKLHKQLESAYDLLAAVDKLGHLVELDTEREDGAVLAAGPLSVRSRAAAFDDLDDVVDFEVVAGGSLALVDPQLFAGSVVAQALYGLRAPTAGRFEVGGDDVRDLSLVALRHRIHYARQPELFEGTLAENLRVGRTRLTPRHLVDALALVELDDELLARAEGGLSMPVLSGSLKLSPTVQRRLMIARAVLDDPSVIVVDGALDGVEPAQAKRIAARLAALPATVVLVTADANIASVCAAQLVLSGDPMSTSKVKP